MSIETTYKKIPTASTTVAGITEHATITETNTGTATDRSITPDGLAGSYAGTKTLRLATVTSESDAQDVNATGNGNVGTVIPSCMNGMVLVNVVVSVTAKGITGTTDIMVRRKRAGADVDMLSTAVTLGDEFFAEDGVVDAANDDVNTGDAIYADIDAIHSGTAAKGLKVIAEFRKP